MTKYIFTLLALLLFTGKVEAAAVRLDPYSGNLNINQQYELEIRLFTELEDVDAVDIDMTYTNSGVEISDGEAGVAGTNIQETDLFENYVYNNIDTTNGTINVTAYTTTPVDTNTGYSVVGKIIFTPTTTGTINFTFDFTEGDLTDTNVAQSVTSDDILTEVRNAQFNVVSGSSTSDDSDSNDSSDNDSSDSEDSNTTSSSSVPTPYGSFGNVNVVEQIPETEDTPEKDKNIDTEVKYDDDAVNIFNTTTVYATKFFSDFKDVVKENKELLTILPAGILAVSFLSFFSFYSFKDLFYLLLRLVNGILKSLKIFAPHDEWGTVYDSKTKRPLDPVYVILYDKEGNKVDSKVTDINGRYGFLSKKGEYRIEVIKTDYKFPSKILEGHTKDYLYNHLYFGETFDIKNDKELIKYNIPMDPIRVNWNEVEKRKYTKFNPIWESIKRRFFKYAPWIALCISTFVLIAEITFWDFVLTSFYYVMFFATIKGKSTNYGQILYKKNEYAPYAKISIRYKSRPERELFNYTTDNKGRYYIITDKNKYIVLITYNDKTYKVEYNAKHGVINTDVVLE